MEKSFDFGRLLENHEDLRGIAFVLHKVKPAEFTSVASGVQKRLESNLKYRKSTRLTSFDFVRNLSRSESPVAVAESHTQSKEEHRRQQLEKWKEEKEKRKKEAAAQKKKPFVVGVPHAPPKFVLPPPLKFVPPPPSPNKLMPSTSRQVTLSQSAKQQNLKQKNPKQKADVKPAKSESFAPKNASFQPPKNLTKGLTLAPVAKTKDNKTDYVFNPILPNKKTKITRKASPKAKRTAKPLQSSSSSETNTASSTEKSPMVKVKTPRKSLKKVAKDFFTPNNPIPKSESSSEERLRSPKSPVEFPMTPEKIAEELKKISPCVTMSRGKDNARREMKIKTEEGLFDEEASDMDSVVHFRQQLQSEVERMTGMCEVWEKINEQTFLSESIEKVRGAVRQARLLIAAKLQQFASLVEHCADDALVTPADPQGIWDMDSNEKQKTARAKNTNVTKTESKLTASQSRVTRNNAKDVTDSKKTKITRKASPKAKRTAKPLQSSSSSETNTASSTEKSPMVKVKTPRKSLKKVAKDFFTPNNPIIIYIESSSEERLRSPKSPVEFPMTPEKIAEELKKISPCVTMSRGKDNARREMKKKTEEGLLDEAASDEVWEKINEQTVLSESIEVRGAAKLQQFASLVEHCAADALVTPADPQGFWDMIYMQLENIDMRLKKLEEQRARYWVEGQPALAQKKAAPRNVAEKTAKPAAPSRVRGPIAARRKAQKEQEEAPAAAEASKTFEASFVRVTSPLRAPLPQTPMTPINLFATPARNILKSANVASEKKAGKKSIKVALFDGDDQKDTEDSPEDGLSSVNKLSELNVDSRMSSMDVDKDVEQTENKRGRMARQDAITEDRHQVMTRSQRRRHTMNNTEPEVQLLKTPRRSLRKKKALQEVNTAENVVEEYVETPRRPVRSRKSVQAK